MRKSLRAMGARAKDVRVVSLMLAAAIALMIGAAACSSGSAVPVAKTAEEMHDLSKQAVNQKAFDKGYLIARKFIEENPDEAEGYLAAIIALHEEAVENFKEINELIAQGAAKTGRMPGR